MKITNILPILIVLIIIAAISFIVGYVFGHHSGVKLADSEISKQLEDLNTEIDKTLIKLDSAKTLSRRLHGE